MMVWVPNVPEVWGLAGISTAPRAIHGRPTSLPESGLWQRVIRGARQPPPEGPVVEGGMDPDGGGGPPGGGADAQLGGAPLATPPLQLQAIMPFACAVATPHRPSKH